MSLTLAGVALTDCAEGRRQARETCVILMAQGTESGRTGRESSDAGRGWSTRGITYDSGARKLYRYALEGKGGSEMKTPLYMEGNRYSD